MVTAAWIQILCLCSCTWQPNGQLRVLHELGGKFSAQHHTSVHQRLQASCWKCLRVTESQVGMTRRICFWSLSICSLWASVRPGCQTCTAYSITSLIKVQYSFIKVLLTDARTLEYNHKVLAWISFGDHVVDVEASFLGYSGLWPPAVWVPSRGGRRCH